MGLRARLRKWWVVKNADSKRVAWREMYRIRVRIRREHGGDLKIVRPLEAEELKRLMHSMAARCDRDYDRVYALDTWRLAKKEYPDLITDADRPVPTVSPSS